MSDFGDADPEDAYDVEDPILVRFFLLRLWVASIALEQARANHDHERVLSRIQSARWAASLLDTKVPKKYIAARLVLAVWLDEMLDNEGGG